MIDSHRQGIRVIALSLLAPLALSLWGPIYFGLRHTPYIALIIWTVLCTLYYLWWSRESFRHMFAKKPDSSIWENLFLVVAIVVTVGGAFLAVQSLIYFFVGRISPVVASSPVTIIAWLAFVVILLAAFYYARLSWREKKRNMRAASDLGWLDELTQEHEAGTRDNSDHIRRLIRSIGEEHEPSAALTARLEKARRILDERG